MKEYTMRTHCTNCGITDVMDIKKGTPVTMEVCITCGCMTLLPLIN